MRFSIVTPVYNAGKYLEEMLESLYAQTFEDWELIIVEDGSTDNSAEILAMAAKRDSRVKPIYLQVNSGSDFVPRRHAIEQAQGEYIVNIDADDTVDAEYLAKIDNLLKTTDADIVYADMVRVKPDGSALKVIPADDSVYGKVFSGADAFRMTLDGWQVSAVGATSREIAIKSLRLFDENMTSEPHWNSYDNENLSRLDLFLSGKVAFCNVAYFYRQVEESVIHDEGIRSFSMLSADMKLAEFTLNNFGYGSEEHILAQRQLFHHVIVFIRILNRQPELSSKEGLVELLREAFAYVDLNLLKGKVSPRYRLLLKSGYSITKKILRLYEH